MNKGTELLKQLISEFENMSNEEYNDLYTEATKHLNAYKEKVLTDEYEISKFKNFLEHQKECSYLNLSWEKFRDHYFYCDRCKSWERGQCMCYTR